MRRLSDPAALLAGLDDEQREAAQALHGAVAIVAGAGTGKTRTITHRIAYGIATGEYAPGSVVALTYTDAAAREMTARLRLLGVAEVQAQTFHSAVMRQFGSFWWGLTESPVPELLADKREVVAEAARLAGHNLDAGALADVQLDIEWRGARGLTDEQYLAAAGARALPTGLGAEQALGIHEAYRAAKERRRVVDFEDAILATAGMLRRERDVRERVQRAWRHFTVDEFQDASPAQAELLSLWAGERGDVCVVGDPRQTIFSFAGADAHGMQRFIAEHPGAQVMELTRNYRSQALILERANRIVREPDLAALEATVGAGPEPQVEVAPTPVHEAETVAAWAAKRAPDGDAGGIAVLARTRSQLALVAEALRGRGLAVAPPHGVDFFAFQAVKRFMATAMHDHSTDRPLFQAVVDAGRGRGLGTAPPSDGPLRQEWEVVRALLALADEQPAGTSPAQFVTTLRALQDAGAQPPMPFVTLTTIHQAKGREWPHVAVVGLSEGLLPNARAVTPEAVAEEQRLFYVAVTRAKESILITRPESISGRPRAASRFLALFGDAA